MTVSDWIWQYLAARGVSHVFYLPGGGSMHLVDALARQDRITPVCMLHEQSCAIAAAAYAMHKNDLGVACVTTGPGGTNAITGLTAAWLDFVPLLVISGQVSTMQMLQEGQQARQHGPQEVEITKIIKPIVKMQGIPLFKARIRSLLPALCDNALERERGPVWLDVPLDVQGAAIE